MNNLMKLSLALSIIFLFAFSSCGDDDANNTPLIERIEGEWNAAEVADGVSSEFTMTLSQSEGEVSFVDNRFPPPFYTLQTFSYPWDEETETFSFGTVTGVVEDENRIVVDYSFGTTTSITRINLVLTR